MNYHNFNNNCKKIKIKSEYSTLYEYYIRKVIITYYNSKGWKRALELIISMIVLAFSITQ